MGASVSDSKGDDGGGSIEKPKRKRKRDLDPGKVVQRIAKADAWAKAEAVEAVTSGSRTQSSRNSTTPANGSSKARSSVSAAKQQAPEATVAGAGTQPRGGDGDTMDV